ncbi:MAG: alginate lyase family protein [Bacteroidetes bacterium]|nr:alginate lyase family protein [Bacteroidota bacterium]
MKAIKIFSVTSLMLCCIAATAQQPAVFSTDAAALVKNKSRIMAKDAALEPAYKQLLKDADKALSFGPVSVMEKKNDPPSGDKHDYMSLAPYFWPNPATKDGLPYIRKDGETNPEVKDYKDKEYMPALCEKVYTLALAYYFSANTKYAEHASKLIRVWFLEKDTRMNPNLNFSQAIKGTNNGRGAGLIDARHFIKLTDAIGLLNGSKYWSKEDQSGMKQWFADFLNWMQTSKNGKDEMNAKNNHGDWYDALRLSITLFIGDKEQAKKIVMNAETRLDKQVDETGMLPLEMVRTTSLHYSGFALQAFFNIAQMAESTGTDFWNYVSSSGKSLKKVFDALCPYLTKQKTWTGQQIKDFDFEEAYPLLLAGAKHMACTRCADAVKNVAGDKAARLSIKLLTDIDF